MPSHRKMPTFADFRYAVRRLSHRPGFFLASVLTLTLGIAFNAAIFSFVNTLLIRPLPVREPDRIVSVVRATAPNLSWPNYEDLRDRNNVFTEVSAARVMPMHLSATGSAMRLWGYLVSGNYFPMLGIEAWRGRLLTPEDDRLTGAHPVAVLSYGAWQRRFGGDESVVGRAVRINGHSFTIIGVTPPAFNGTERLIMSEIWVPFSMIQAIEGRDWRPYRTAHNAWAIARLKPGVSSPQANASLRTLSAEMAAEHPTENEGMVLRAVSPGLFGSVLKDATVNISIALMAVAALMLLVSCTNLSGLLLAHATDRRKEFSIRAAIGGSRWHVMRMMLAETGVLAVCGCALGLLTAVWLTDLAANGMPAMEFPVLRELALDWRVVAFTAGVSLISLLVSGLLPAWRSARVDVVTALKGDPGWERLRRFHLRDLYAAVQVTVSVVLLASSGMMVRTLQRSLHVPVGFDPDRAVVLKFDTGLQGYNRDRAREFDRRLIERIRSLPGVEAAGIANSIPFSIDQSNSSILAEGAPVLSMTRLPSATVYQAGPGYFSAMGTRLLEGRGFDDRDTKDSPRVAVVNRAFAEKILGGGGVGKRFRLGTAGDWRQVIGVVETGKYTTITEDPTPVLWESMAQNYNSNHTLIARVRTSETEALKQLRTVMKNLDPELPVYDDKPLRDYMDLPLAPLRITTWALTGMASAAAFLSGMGLYALLSYSLARRRREIGVRVALGATPAAVVKAIGGRTVLLLTLSSGCGLLASLFATRLLARLLYAQADPLAFAGALAIVGSIALAAAIAPIRRAVRLEPMTAVREE